MALLPSELATGLPVYRECGVGRRLTIYREVPKTDHLMQTQRVYLLMRHEISGDNPASANAAQNTQQQSLRRSAFS